ncbi:MAG: methionyl-tRNA formyltransferase [Lachnospiraceae bacterium]|nr:methionyl-tRNA formyltransferase [Lachnospiraceae bacterium]MDD7284178.1 methionyl-tRNA formyltransferase [Clostridium sp.]
MRIVYMGTPEFAAVALDAIVKEHEVVAVITQPDKPQGRNRKLVPTPVKVKAQAYDIPVYQPVKIREEESVQMIRDYNPDVIVVAAYGQILPESILNIPKYGCINIHASLLPKYRGAAPIERAIIDGEVMTGVTTMYMEKGLDTGDMIEKVEVPITGEDTGASLHDKLAEAGAALILTTLAKLEAGTVTRTKQDDAQSCYAAMLTKELGRMDFTRPAVELERLIRGLNPWPCAYTTIDGKNVKLYKAEVINLDAQMRQTLQEKSEQILAFAPGEIVEVAKKYFVIACGEGALRVRNLQPEGKKAMDTSAYLNGNPLKPGMRAGEER